VTYVKNRQFARGRGDEWYSCTEPGHRYVFIVQTNLMTQTEWASMFILDEAAVLYVPLLLAMAYLSFVLREEQVDLLVSVSEQSPITQMIDHA
jgi:hypothetical protein